MVTARGALQLPYTSGPISRFGTHIEVAKSHKRTSATEIEHGSARFAICGEDYKHTDERG